MTKTLLKTDTRGKKRKCQSDTCHRPFYDLDRAEFDCPYCGTTFDHEVELRATTRVPDRRFQRKTFTVGPAPEQVQAEPAAAFAAEDPAEEIVQDAEEFPSTGEAEELIDVDDSDDEAAEVPLKKSRSDE